MFVLRLHKAAEIARSHTSTDSVTCTTSDTWKKSMNGIQPCTIGVRASTSNTEKTPAKTSETRPIASQAEVAFRAPVPFGVNS